MAFSFVSFWSITLLDTPFSRFSRCRFSGLWVFSRTPLVAFERGIIRLAVPALAAAVDCEQRLDLERQAEELAEAVGVLLVVDVLLAKGGVVLAVEAER